MTVQRQFGQKKACVQLLADIVVRFREGKRFVQVTFSRLILTLVDGKSTKMNQLFIQSHWTIHLSRDVDAFTVKLSRFLVLAFQCS